MCVSALRCVHWTVWKLCVFVRVVFCYIYHVTYAVVHSHQLQMYSKCLCQAETFDWLQCKYFVHLVLTELFWMKIFFMRGIVPMLAYFFPNAFPLGLLVKVQVMRSKIQRRENVKRKTRKHTDTWKRPLERESWYVYITTVVSELVACSSHTKPPKEPVIRWDEAYTDNGGIVIQHNRMQPFHSIPFHIWTGLDWLFLFSHT